MTGGCFDGLKVPPWCPCELREFSMVEVLDMYGGYYGGFHSPIYGLIWFKYDLNMV